LQIAQLGVAAVDPSVILKDQAIDADPWQKFILFCTDQQILMNCLAQSRRLSTTSP
jgi:hypothetical protein